MPNFSDIWFQGRYRGLFCKIPFSDPNRIQCTSLADILGSLNIKWNQAPPSLNIKWNEAPAGPNSFSGCTNILFQLGTKTKLNDLFSSIIERRDLNANFLSF